MDFFLLITALPLLWQIFFFLGGGQVWKMDDMPKKGGGEPGGDVGG
jgi:hypothetical protein